MRCLDVSLFETANPPASVHVLVGKLSPSCLVVRPPVVALPAVRFCSMRLILFCPCPPGCAEAQWPMPDWVWSDVRSFPPIFTCIVFNAHRMTRCQWRRRHTSPALLTTLKRRRSTRASRRLTPTNNPMRPHMHHDYHRRCAVECYLHMMH